MTIKFYNTLTRTKEEFKPIDRKSVGIYSCGPTVYWNQHIGHMYCYTQWDTLVRFLRCVGYDVKWVMNITDVGHLTSDEDAGEDKMEKGAKREGLTVWQIADKYLEQFKESMKLLNINEPNVLCRATEHIDEQIELIKKIEKNGFAYMTKTGLVFDTAKFPDYAKFSNLDIEGQKAGSRVEVDTEKKSAHDFLLWVTNQPGHIMKWPSPWGVGFPGWHIECTAMSTKYLGEQFDIHTGGREHIPVHHTNEIAQAYGAFGRQTANYWLHNEWLLINGGKMSKSDGTSITVSNLIDKGYSPLALRYLILTSHYSQGLNFTWESLSGAQTALNRLYEIAKNLSKEKTNIADDSKSKTYKNDFLSALSDDLSTPKAIAVMWQMLKDKALSDSDKLKLLLDWDNVLGLKIKENSENYQKQQEEEIPEEVKRMVQEREIARSEKNWKKSDELRIKIKESGYEIKDTDEGQKITKQ